MNVFFHIVSIPHTKYRAAMNWCYANIDDGGESADDHEFAWYTNIKAIGLDDTTHDFFFKDEEIATWFQLTFN